MSEQQPIQTGAEVDEQGIKPPPAFTLKVPADDVPVGTVLIELEGELDMAAAEPFRAHVERAAAEGAEKLVIDLQAMTFMDSSMLRELLRAQRSFTGAGGEIWLVAPPPSARRLLEITLTLPLFQLADDRAAALSA